MTRYRSGTEDYPTRATLAEMRGYDPHSDDALPPAQHLMPAPGVDALAAFAANVEAARHAAACRGCGERCDDCGDRMCSEFGPEPRACGVTCAACRCECTGCLDARGDLRMELLCQLEKDAT